MPVGQADNRKTKLVAEQVVYEINWSNALRDGDVIATSNWAITGSDSALTNDNTTISADGLKTYVRLKVGTAGVVYQVRNTVVTTTSPAETLVEDLIVTVK